MSACFHCGGKGKFYDEVDGEVDECDYCAGTGRAPAPAQAVKVVESAATQPTPEGMDAAAMLDEIVSWFPDCAQLLDGWHSDGTAWTEWDESIRKRLASLWSKALSVLPTQAGTAAPPSVLRTSAPEGIKVTPAMVAAAMEAFEEAPDDYGNEGAMWAAIEAALKESPTPSRPEKE